MQGGSEVTLSAHATLTSTTTKQLWARPPIDVDFQVLMFTASGLIVRFLKVFEKSNYQSVKWVRYLTKASGSYQVRVSNFLCLWGRKVGFVLINSIGVVLNRLYVHVFRSQFCWTSYIYQSIRVPLAIIQSLPAMAPCSVVVCYQNDVHVFRGTLHDTPYPICP